MPGKKVLNEIELNMWEFIALTPVHDFLCFKKNIWKFIYYCVMLCCCALPFAFASLAISSSSFVIFSPIQPVPPTPRPSSLCRRQTIRIVHNIHTQFQCSPSGWKWNICLHFQKKYKNSNVKQTSLAHFLYIFLPFDTPNCFDGWMKSGFRIERMK